ncbi:hypothetical protein AMJ57_05745 [Parcubacteria bacterium SG8_24]|nr:MAG: hypothetical protein AMJ57_05745 [Parcubacteria bacterium SG8_24]
MATKDIERKKVELDADGRSIGRLAAEISRILQGKHKPAYEPHRDHGDFVDVRNAAKVKILGNRLTGKVYYRYSGYPGGIKSTNLQKLMEKDPSEAIRRAVRNMLPKNRLRNGRMKRLTVHND